MTNPCRSGYDLEKFFWPARENLTISGLPAGENRAKHKGMKTNPAPTESSNAVREATLKVAKLRRIVEAETKLAQAAKVRFKGAKKTWKLARKTAKRSAKKLKRAEKNLAALTKQIKPAAAKSKPKAKVSRPAKPAAKKPARSVRRKPRRATAVVPPAIVPVLETASTSAADVVMPLPDSEPQQA
jgi:hypothetical protein